MSRRSRGNSAPITLFSFQDLITSLSGILILLVLLMAINLGEHSPQNHTETPAKDDLNTEAAIAQARVRTSELKEQIAMLQSNLTQTASQDVVDIVQALTEAERHSRELTRQLARLEAEQATLNSTITQTREQLKFREVEMQTSQAEIDRLQQALSVALQHKNVFVIPEEGSPKTPVLVECSSGAVRVGYVDRDQPPIVFTPNESGFTTFAELLSSLSPSREYIVVMIKPSSVDYYTTLIALAMAGNFDVGYDALEENSMLAFGRAAP